MQTGFSELREQFSDDLYFCFRVSCHELYVVDDASLLAIKIAHILYSANFVGAFFTSANKSIMRVLCNCYGSRRQVPFGRVKFIMCNDVIADVVL